MKLDALYRKAVSVGIANDPRGPDAVRRILDDERKKSEKLKDDERDAWDADRLFNPYADTRLLAGDPAAEVRKLIVGIDMDAAEVLLAHTLNRDRAAGIDLVVAHHPQGVALAQLPDVMRVQSDMLAAYGVNISVAEQLMDKRIGEVERRVLPANHNRAVDAARLLGLPMMCLHTPADNCVNTHLAALFEREKPARLKDLVDLLKRIPEYRAAVRRMAGPKIVSGAENAHCGKISVEMTGGTEGAKTIYEAYAVSGREHDRQHAHQRGGPRERQEGPPQHRPGRPHLERHAGAEPALRRDREGRAARVRRRFGIREDPGVRALEPAVVALGAQGHDPAGEGAGVLEVARVGMGRRRGGHVGPGLVLGRLHQDLEGLHRHLPPAGERPDELGLGHEDRGVLEGLPREPAARDRAVGGEEGDLLSFGDRLEEDLDRIGDAVGLDRETREDELVRSEVARLGHRLERLVTRQGAEDRLRRRAWCSPSG